jgi:asparagine synthase (glutamine-hydrolysing)
VCGIFGIFGKNGAVSESQVRHLTDLVAHRGPDGSGIYIDGNIGLGHRRLAIIDLSENGAQPMRHFQQPVWITYNGEIYNYLELREELEALGSVFATATDTEVLLNAYLAWGEECLNRFNGMWAFAIYDQRDNTMFCARDRFGVKPFYYVNTPVVFSFGSEIRQLLPFIDNREPDDQLINDFLVCGLTDHTARTFFKGIEKLAPGHCLRVQVATGEIEIERFYSLSSSIGAADDGIDAAPGLVQALLRDAVDLRLRSDVRVGTCLSGGLDSSSVAALASSAYSQASNEKFCAITAISEQATNSEERYAGRIVEKFDLNWIRTAPTYEDFASNIEALINIQEEPFGGPSIVMQYEVMKAARSNKVTVLLDGQGGDETLLGYERYYAAWLLDHLRSGGIGGFLSAFRSAVSVNANLSILRLAIYLIGASSTTARSLFYRWRYRFLKTVALPESLGRFVRSTRDASAMQVLEITETNLPMLLRFEDKNSMHFGIETRLPFLDYRFVELALGLSTRVKLRDGWTKWPLREAMRSILPDDIGWRRDKIGFAAPDQLWLARHMEKMRVKIFASDIVAKYVDMPALKKRFNKVDLGMRWRLYCLAVWGDQFKVCA